MTDSTADRTTGLWRTDHSKVCRSRLAAAFSTAIIFTLLACSNSKYCCRWGRGKLRGRGELENTIRNVLRSFRPLDVQPSRNPTHPLLPVLSRIHDNSPQLRSSLTTAFLPSTQVPDPRSPTIPHAFKTSHPNPSHFTNPFSLFDPTPRPPNCTLRYSCLATDL